MAMLIKMQEFFMALSPEGIIQEAYDKDFRWWFLALLVMMLAGGLWALKYLLNQAEIQRVSHNTQIQALVNELTSSRVHHHDRVEHMQAEAFRIVKEVTEIIAATKVVIESNTRESENVRRTIERLERKELKN